MTSAAGLMTQEGEHTVELPPAPACLWGEDGEALGMLVVEVWLPLPSQSHQESLW